MVYGHILRLAETSFLKMKEIIDNNIRILSGDIMKEIQTIRDNLGYIENNFREQQTELYKAKNEANRYKIILLEFLKSKVGQKIYWAHKNWKKYETHTISAVNVDIQKSDFFGEKYVGKECIRIYLEDGGYYIADDIGETLFFSEGEAALRSCKK